MATQNVMLDGFGDFLAEMASLKIITDDELLNVLDSRAAFARSFSGVAPNYTGYVGSNVDGSLVYSADTHGVLLALDGINASGKLGYFRFVTSPYKVDASWDSSSGSVGDPVGFTIRGDTMLGRGATLTWQVDWYSSTPSLEQTDTGSVALPANGVYSNTLTVPANTEEGHATLTATLIGATSTSDLPIDGLPPE